jgi:quinol---cytochrome c reductase iron-sulfur subunit, bacillus type
MTDPSEETSQQELSRREFMDRSIKAIGAFIGISLGVPAVGYLISPALQRQQSQWVRLGRTSQVKTGVPTLFTVTLDKTTGWVRSEIELSYFVYTEDAVNFTVMSNICTHLGCQTHWNDEAGYIVCPCHGGHFDVQGNVIAGPPPRPLKRIDFKVDENDNILIQEV